MRRFLAVALAVVATTALVSADFADARRLGGGRSFGAQRQQVTPAPTTPPAAAPSAPGGAASNPVMPAQPGAATARAAPGAPAAAAQPARGASRWLGPVAGLAAGLGLAALAAHLGIAEELMSVMLVVLIAIAAIALLRALLSRRAGAGRSPPMAYAPSGAAPERAPVTPTKFEPLASGPGAAVAPSSFAGRYPPGFEPAPFLEQAKQQFARLQAAYDRGDRAALADVMTPDMFADVARELDTRSGHVATEIVAINPEIVDVTTEGDQHWASVRFRGLLREDGAPMPKPFDELWNLVKPVDGSSGWLLAGIRQLDEEPAGHA